MRYRLSLQGRLAMSPEHGWGGGVYLNEVRNGDGVIGYVSTVTYHREPGPTEIVLRWSTPLGTGHGRATPSPSPARSGLSTCRWPGDRFGVEPGASRPVRIHQPGVRAQQSRARG